MQKSPISVNLKRRLLALFLSVTITSSFSAGKNYNCPRTPLLGLTTPLQMGEVEKKGALVSQRRNHPAQNSTFHKINPACATCSERCSLSTTRPSIIATYLDRIY